MCQAWPVTDVASVGGADLVWAAATDVGRARSLNEDSLLAAPPVFVVADGMGGHEAGEIASALVVERLRGLATGVPASVEAVVAEIRHVNSLLVEAGGGGSRSMGTTATILAVVDNGGTTSWLVGNVGDSRAYCWRRDRLNQITRDHSFVQDLLEAGAVDAAEARRHPQRNLVTRALGLSEDVEADFWVRPVRPGERFLLCSDGLTGELTDDEIAAEMALGAPPADTVERLVRLAVEAGGRDNVTAVVVDVQGTPAPVSPEDDDDDGLSITTGRRPFRKVDLPPSPVDDRLIAQVPIPDRSDRPAPSSDPGSPITDVPVSPAAAGDPPAAAPGARAHRRAPIGPGHGRRAGSLHGGLGVTDQKEVDGRSPVRAAPGGGTALGGHVRRRARRSTDRGPRGRPALAARPRRGRPRRGGRGGRLPRRRRPRRRRPRRIGPPRGPRRRAVGDRPDPPHARWPGRQRDVAPHVRDPAEVGPRDDPGRRGARRARRADPRHRPGPGLRRRAARRAAGRGRTGLLVRRRGRGRHRRPRQAVTAARSGPGARRRRRARPTADDAPAEAAPAPAALTRPATDDEVDGDTVLVPRPPPPPPTDTAQAPRPAPPPPPPPPAVAPPPPVAPVAVVGGDRRRDRRRHGRPPPAAGPTSRAPG